MTFTIGLPTALQAQDLLLFGGDKHDIFLGCMNCNKYDSDSICNQYGTFGSKYASSSIFNQYGNFGSKYSSSSPWNKYASSDSVPILVNKSGDFYGYFTINKYRHNAVKSVKELAEIYEIANGDLEIVRNIICK